MGNIDDAVPFFGKGFNKIYPLIMVIYTILIATNFFDRVINYMGNWKIFRYQREESDDLDGFDPSGLIILQKERSWLQQGHKVGELVVPLARSFSNTTIDLEPGSLSGIQTSRLMEEGQSSHSGPIKSASQKDAKREEVSVITTQATMRSQASRHDRDSNAKDKESHEMSACDAENNMIMQGKRTPPRIAATWESMKSGFLNFKSRIEENKFIPLRQVQDTNQHGRVSSSESLDEIFERIRKPTTRHTSNGADDYDGVVGDDIKRPSENR